MNVENISQFALETLYMGLTFAFDYLMAGKQRFIYETKREFEYLERLTALHGTETKTETEICWSNKTFHSYESAFENFV